MSVVTNEQATTLTQIVALCKRRGFVFPSSEIYGGFAAVYDYGPYGVELLSAIKRSWWKATVQMRDDIVGLDSAIFMHPRIWEASGHVAGFSDPLAECKECNARVRVDQLLESIGVVADEKMELEAINELFLANVSRIKCPACGKNNFTDVKKFNLLVSSNLGNFSGDPSRDPVYLRGETCQGIYVNYKNVMASSRVKIPFGIAQIGKAFRNEITARQFIFRTREFEQMELQYFTHPNDEMVNFAGLRAARMGFYEQLGFDPKNLQWHEHENLVFYAKAAYDIQYRFPWGFAELEGVHARGNYDLTQHMKYSGVDLSYTDPVTQEKFVPHIVESSVGVGRLFLAALCEAYREEKLENGETRTVLKLPRALAPVQVATFPLLRNRPELVELARRIHYDLRGTYRCEFDDGNNIGKRYRRQDEIGTPFCITVDFRTLEKGIVTVRDRDTLHQQAVPTERLKEYLRAQFED